MRRREFITFVGGAAVACPFVALAQQAPAKRRIGWIITLTSDHADGQGRLAAFREGLAALGWIEGRNLLIDYRWGADDDDKRRTYGAELVSLKPDAIMVGGGPALTAVLAQTRTIPTVFVATAGSAEHGLITNAARPAGNATGFTLFDQFSLAGKLLETLKEIAPHIARVALVIQRDHPSLAGYARTLEHDAPALGVAFIASPVASSADIERTIASMAREPNGGLLLPPDQFLLQHRDLIVASTAKHRLPAIYGYRYFVAAGGLVSYGVDADDLYRRAAGYVDRILNGERPSDLPVQAPTRYELTVNLKTAKALGLDIPPTILARADEVIE
jgi:putative tryptophan/tyrosine transport system substrate-binding protein